MPIEFGKSARLTRLCESTSSLSWYRVPNNAVAISADLRYPVSMPSKIQLLPPFVAERIAAGEVIERPASVVKELVENSIDSGARFIDVRLEEGGKTLIEVTDNGSGIAKEDLALALERHATSKLQALEDLENLSSLGFRGEALPSIAAVSDISILSRADNSEEAIELLRLNGQPLQMTPIPWGRFVDSKWGTRVTVRGLFSSLPARLKFLRSSASELGAIREWIERVSLSCPAVGFRLDHEGQEVFYVPSGQDFLSRAKIVLGNSTGAEFTHLTSDQQDPDFNLEIVWLKSLSVSHTRKIIQILNGRALKDRVLQSAILSPLRQNYLPGRFPAIAVKLRVRPDSIDVNVHPSKMEVRFDNPDKIHSAVFGLLKKGQAVGSVNFQPPANHPSALPISWLPSHDSGFVSTSPVPPLENQTLFSRSETNMGPLEGAVFRSILFQTYLVFEKETGLVLVDQHAAHERIRYEQLRDAWVKGMVSGTNSQSLMIPEVARVPGGLPVSDVLKYLRRLGFDAESFGQSQIVFRAIPADWGNTSLAIRLQALVERASDVRDTSELSPAMDEEIFEKIAMEACRSSIKAGDSLNSRQVSDLVTDLFKTSHPWNCPHGRPSIFEMSQAQLETAFLRRVHG